MEYIEKPEEIKEIPPSMENIYHPIPKQDRIVFKTYSPVRTIDIVLNIYNSIL